MEHTVAGSDGWTCIYIYTELVLVLTQNAGVKLLKIAINHQTLTTPLYRPTLPQLVMG